MWGGSRISFPGETKGTRKKGTPQLLVGCPVVVCCLGPCLSRDADSLSLTYTLLAKATTSSLFSSPFNIGGLSLTCDMVSSSHTPKARKSLRGSLALSLAPSSARTLLAAALDCAESCSRFPKHQRSLSLGAGLPTDSLLNHGARSRKREPSPLDDVARALV